jgi:hypothetical protein
MNNHACPLINLCHLYNPFNPCSIAVEVNKKICNTSILRLKSHRKNRVLFEFGGYTKYSLEPIFSLISVYFSIPCLLANGSGGAVFCALAIQ